MEDRAFQTAHGWGVSFKGPWLMSVELSCEDKNTVEPQVTRCRKIAMAAVWESLVCGVHNADYWEFAEGWH
jgi:hypothetical protein